MTSTDSIIRISADSIEADVASLIEQYGEEIPLFPARPDSPTVRTIFAHQDHVDHPNRLRAGIYEESVDGTTLADGSKAFIARIPQGLSRDLPDKVPAHVRARVSKLTWQQFEDQRIQTEEPTP